MRYAKPIAVAAVGLLCLYTAWRVVLNRGAGSDLIAAGQTATDFMTALQTGDYDKAYSLTSFSYSTRIGRKGLEDLAARYSPLRNVADPGAVDLKTRRVERTTLRHFMCPKVAAPKDVHDYLPVVVKMVIGTKGGWRVDDVVIYDR
jgi:hypothetical protein